MAESLRKVGLGCSGGLTQTRAARAHMHGWTLARNQEAFGLEVQAIADALELLDECFGLGGGRLVEVARSEVAGGCLVLEHVRGGFED